MIVLDTNVVSELMRPSPASMVKSWIATQPRGSLFTTTITRAEVLFGALLLPEGRRRGDLLARAESLFEEDFREQLLDFDRDAARHFAALAAQRKSQGRPIGIMDAQIAAIARSRGAAVATRDVADFRDCGIEVIDPWSA